MKTNLFFLIVLACFLSCQNQKDFPAPELPVPDETELPPALIPRQDIKLSSVEQELSVQANSFAFNLFKTVYTNEEAHKNILLSPLSVTLAFSMLNNGAFGATQDEIQRTIGFDDVSVETINVYAQKLVDAIQTLDTRGVFESANSIWIQKGFPVFDAFKQVNRQHYEAEIQNVDFGLQTTLNQINSWVNDKTHGKIPTILDDFPTPLTRMMLLNALYFKGYWTEPFDKELTVDAVFHTSTGTEQMVPTMRKGLSRYSKTGNCAAVELPFGNGAFSLVVVLPDEDTPLSEVIVNMDGGWWEAITDFNKLAAEMHIQKRQLAVLLDIPRFKLEYRRNLNDDLMALGMQTPFDPEAADFSLISKEALHVSKVEQKTFAQMDEEGIEAAAATLIEMPVTSVEPIETVCVDFKVDRPFLFFIKEKSTNLVFFAGVINKID